MLQILFSSVRVKLLARATLIFLREKPDDYFVGNPVTCSVKTVECGQMFILACQQLRKKGQHNFIGQLKNLCDVPRSIFIIIALNGPEPLFTRLSSLVSNLTLLTLLDYIRH